MTMVLNIKEIKRKERKILRAKQRQKDKKTER